MTKDQLEKRIFDLEQDLVMRYNKGDIREKTFVRRKIKQYKNELEILENNEEAFGEKYE